MVLARNVGGVTSAALVFRCGPADCSACASRSGFFTWPWPVGPCLFCVRRLSRVGSFTWPCPVGPWRFDASLRSFPGSATRPCPVGPFLFAASRLSRAGSFTRPWRPAIVSVFASVLVMAASAVHSLLSRQQSASVALASTRRRVQLITCGRLSTASGATRNSRNGGGVEGEL